MSKIAVIKTGGRQYVVKEGDKLKVERINLGVGEKVILDDVLLVEDSGEVKVGLPKVDGVKVEGKVLDQGRGKKIEVVKYKPKTRYTRKIGHRQSYTLVGIESISVGSS